MRIRTFRLCPAFVLAMSCAWVSAQTPPIKPGLWEVKSEGKLVQFMSPPVCMCSTMQRIDPQHLAWTLENLAEGNVVNRISVPEHEAVPAKLALDRMLEVS